jgi:hypothetical protein
MNRFIDALDIDVSDLICDHLSGIFKYNQIGRPIPDLIINTPFMPIDIYVIKCVKEGYIPVELLCTKHFVKGINYIELDKFNQKMQEIEALISTDAFKQTYFGTSNMILKRNSLNVLGYGTYFFGIPFNEYNCNIIREEFHFKKDTLDRFMCPITGTVPIEPVLFDKHIYDRNAIIQWLGRSRTSPLTRRSHDDTGNLLEINELSLEELEEFNSYKKSEYTPDDEIVTVEKRKLKQECNYGIGVFFEIKDKIMTRINTYDMQPEEYLQDKMKVKISFDMRIKRNKNEYHLLLLVRSIINDKN